LSHRYDQFHQVASRLREGVLEGGDRAFVAGRFVASGGVTEPLGADTVLDQFTSGELFSQLAHPVEFARQRSGAANDLAAGIDIAPILVFAIATHGVEILESEADWIH